MSWARFDDQYPDHPKIVEVGPLGLALHTAATCYCARYLTDGFIPAAMMGRLLNFDGITVNSNAVTNKEVTDELIRVGLLEVVPGGYNVHDYLDYNPPAEQVKAEKALNAARQKKWRDEHRDNEGKFNSNGQHNALLIPAPSPSPSPKKKRVNEAKPRDPLLDNLAVIAYREVCKLTPNEIQRQDISTKIVDVELWRGVCTEWMRHGWKPGNIPGMIDAYSVGGIKSNGNGLPTTVRRRKPVERDE